MYGPRGAPWRERRTSSCWRWRTGSALVLVTVDEDFGELVFVRRLRHPCIVRLVEMTVAEQVDAMRDLIERHGDAMREGAIVVATRRRVRIRAAGGGERDDG